MATKEKILEKIEASVPLKVEAKSIPSEFFQTKEGLYVWVDFKERILKKAKPIEAGQEFKISSYNLIKRGTDIEIEAELPEKHIFSESEACAVIAELIAKQPKGEDGLLLNNGRWNLFYTESFVVDVGWSSWYREWFVGTWDRGDDQWLAGDRVFSPATEN